MPSRVQSAPVIGLPQIRGWSQVVSNSARNLTCSFSIEGENANNLGRDFVSKVVDMEVDSSSKLHQQLLDTLASIRRSNCKMQLACCLVLENKIVLVTHNAFILLHRGNKSGTILSSTDKLNIIEGKITPTDTFVLATKQTQPFLEEISQRLTQNIDIDTIITSVVPGLHGLENSSLSAITFISLEEEKKEEPEYVPTLPLQPLPAVEPTPTEEPTPTAEPTPIEEPIPAIKPAVRATIVDTPTPLEVSPLADESPIVPEPPPTIQPTYTPEPTPIISHQPIIKKQSRFAPLSKKIKANTASFFTSVKNSIRKTSLSLKKIPSTIKHVLPSKDTYVGRAPNKKTVRIFLGVIVGIIIVIGLVVWQQSNVSQTKARTQLQLDPIIAQVDEAKNQINDSPFEAREKVNNSINELEQLANDNESNKVSFKIINQKLLETKAYYEEISGRDEFSDLSVFFDLRLVESDFNTTQSDLTAKSAYFIDTGTGKAISLDLEKKQSKSIPTNAEKTYKDISSTEDSLFLIGGGIHQIKLDNIDTTKQLKEEGESDRSGTLLDSFGPYIYVFNPEKRNIYRYLAKENELSSPIGWLISKQGIEFDKVNSMVIDGDVWLGTDNGEIKKFTRGTEEEFNIEGMPEPFSTPVSIFTEEELEHIYILEQEQRRIVILTKDGKFIREIKSESLASVTNILANEELKKIFAISGSIVFEIGL